MSPRGAGKHFSVVLLEQLQADVAEAVKELDGRTGEVLPEQRAALVDRALEGFDWGDLRARVRLWLMGEAERENQMGKNFIAGAIKKPGQLHRDLGVPQGKKIPEGKLEAAASRPGKVGQRARFAETLKGMRRGGRRGA